MHLSLKTNVGAGYINNGIRRTGITLITRHNWGTSSNYFKQEAPLMLTNPCDAFRGQSRSPNMVLFNILGMVPFTVL